MSHLRRGLVANLCLQFSFEICRIRKFPGQTEPTMSVEVELISTIAEKKSWTRPPIQMEFQVLKKKKFLCASEWLYMIMFYPDG